ncbi:hypothetical protein V6N13_103502 [Hibiscus sabdariffa]
MYGSRITVSFAIRAGRDVSWQRCSERRHRDRPQGSIQSITGGRREPYRRVMGILDEAKGEVLASCAVAWCKESLRGATLVNELHQAGLKGCSFIQAAGDMVLLLFATLEERQAVLDRSDFNSWFTKVVAWSPDIIISSRSVWISLVGVPVSLWSSDTFENIARLWGSLCETVVGASVSSGYKEEGANVSPVDPGISRAAVQGWREPDRLVMEGSLDEVVGMVRQTDMNEARLVEGQDFEEIMLPRTTQRATGRLEDGDGVVEVPPCLSEVVVSGGVPRKVRSVNELVLDGAQGAQGAVL